MKEQNAINGAPLWIREVKSSQAHLIDLRDYEEWQELHLPCSILSPLSELKKRDLSGILCWLEPYISSPLYLHCRSGARAHHAQRLLAPHHPQVEVLEATVEQLLAWWGLSLTKQFC